MPSSSFEATLHSPAKINWFLAITGVRDDGFHNLVSLVSPLAFGDTITVSGDEAFSFSSTGQAFPDNATNLVIKAVRAFERQTSVTVRGHFHLTKSIPVGAGLGGGSSNAAAVLKYLAQTYAPSLDHDKLTELAAEIGSDVPLFLNDGPVLMRGRGEKLAPLTHSQQNRLKARKLILFKPEFSISTPWAYGQLKATAPASYCPSEAAEEMVQEWLESDKEDTSDLLFNSFEDPIFRKYMTYDALFERLREKYGLHPLLSGSGSCCFVEICDENQTANVIEMIRDAWGKFCFIVETQTL